MDSYPDFDDHAAPIPALIPSPPVRVAFEFGQAVLEHVPALPVSLLIPEGGYYYGAPLTAPVD